MYLKQGMSALGHGSLHFPDTLSSAAGINSSHNEPLSLEHCLKKSIWELIRYADPGKVLSK